MLRANVYCTLISSPGQVKAATGYGSWLVQSHNSLRPLQRVTARALKDGGGFQGRNWDPGLEIEVPFEQRPVNEYSSLKDGALYSWGELGPGQFFLRLGSLWLVTFTILGAPIAAASFNPYEESGWYDGQMWVKPPEGFKQEMPLDVKTDDKLAAEAAEAADGRPVYL